MCRILLSGLLVSIVSLGCGGETSVVTSPPAIKSTPVVVSEPIPETPSQQDEPKQESKSGGLFDKAKGLLKQAADSGSEEAGMAQEWMSDKFGDASESSSQIAEDATKWASDAFDSLKQKGLTSADSASEWVTQDIRNMNALKYKVVTVSMDDLEAVEDKLNELGKLRWDCFHAVEKDGKTVLMFKKERRSLLKNIPVNDMLRLVPLMGNSSNE